MYESDHDIDENVNDSLVEQLYEQDFRLSNILLRPTGFNELSKDELIKQLGEPNKEPLLTIFGKSLAPLGPKYLVKGLSLDRLDTRFISDQVYIIDFSESYYIYSLPKDLGITASFYSPKLLFDNTISHSAAIEKDITRHIMGILEQEYPDRIVYVTSWADEELLAKIIADEGVLEVRWKFWEKATEGITYKGEGIGGELLRETLRDEGVMVVVCVFDVVYYVDERWDEGADVVLGPRPTNYDDRHGLRGVVDGDRDRDRGTHRIASSELLAASPSKRNGGYTTIGNR
ncbi:hypothetical protein G7Y89_g13623 [Cudoniella acicularis]|uniref:Uncharacterized protein n=1 Tax=Cudoniella acicularis TaxID=354080 RepID=A0A8H4RAB4_9HELO|nr:hypothetical protein G7Y89_g13623 [Cudoniella acicularis]